MVPSRVVSIAETQAASAYDRFVAESPQGSVFCTSWWLDAVAPGSWRAHEVEEKERIIAAWPTVARTTRLGVLHVGAPLTPFLGPLFPPGEGARQASQPVIFATTARIDRTPPAR